MTLKEINEKIDKLEKGVNSSATPEQAKETMKAKLKELKAKRDDLEKKEEEIKKKPEKPAKPASSKKPEKPKREPRPKITKEDAETCNRLIKEMQALLNEHKATSTTKPKKKTTKKISTRVAEGIVSKVSVAVNKEITVEKVGKIKVDELREARDHGERMLKSLRKALGGISDSNDQILKTFKNEFNALIEKVEKKQKEVKEKQAA